MQPCPLNLNSVYSVFTLERTRKMAEARRPEERDVDELGLRNLRAPTSPAPSLGSLRARGRSPPSLRLRLRRTRTWVVDQAQARGTTFGSSTPGPWDGSQRGSPNSIGATAGSSQEPERSGTSNLEQLVRETRLLREQQEQQRAALVELQQTLMQTPLYRVPPTNPVPLYRVPPTNPIPQSGMMGAWQPLIFGYPNGDIVHLEPAILGGYNVYLPYRTPWSNN
jgi:hypothetical protein